MQHIQISNEEAIDSSAVILDPINLPQSRIRLDPPQQSVNPPLAALMVSSSNEHQLEWIEAVGSFY